MSSTDRGKRRLKKLPWRVHVPAFADNHGVLLPTRHPTTSNAIRKDIYFGDYESKESEIVAKRLTNDDVVMEVGTGIGYPSAFCVLHIGSDRVFAYEANRAMMEAIRLTHRVNSVAPSVKNTPLAIGTGQRDFHVAEDFWASSSLTTTSGARTIDVQQTDLNSEIATVRPTFMIVDIEGGEIESLAIGDLTGVRKICVETHHGVLDELHFRGCWRIFSRRASLSTFR